MTLREAAAALLAVTLAACSGGPPGARGPGTDDATPGAAPGCGEPEVEAGLNAFAYAAEGLADCRDVQAYEFSYDDEWNRNGGQLVVSQPEGGAVRVEVLGDALSPYCAFDGSDWLGGCGCWGDWGTEGTATVRIVLDGATGRVEVTGGESGC